MAETTKSVATTTTQLVVGLADVCLADVERVGGKNASLGEMLRHLTGRGVRVPRGFATTADGYRLFLEHNQLDQLIVAQLAALNSGRAALADIGRAVRRAILEGEWPPALAAAIVAEYRALAEQAENAEIDVAVRSSATAEDLPEASFAGQQESFLNVRGADALLDACRQCYASLFTDRAISYRQAQGFDHAMVALSVGVQRMVRADLGAAGVMFSIDTETGFDRVVLINAAWGLGESVVQGAVDPDEYQVFKPLLSDASCSPIVHKRCGGKTRKMVYTEDPAHPTRNVATSEAERRAYVLQDEEILALARCACEIESHYGLPMDIEWAKDGATGELFVVQARPETVHGRRSAAALRTYHIKRKGRQLVSGASIGEAVVSGRVCVIESALDIDRFVDGSVLVTGITDPDWVPIMKRAVGIVTDFGGRTSHAAIVSRELGLPAIVGTGTATQILREGQQVTVSCAEGDVGFVYEGEAEVDVEELDLASIPATRTKIMLNLANPAGAFHWWRLPADGVGLARMEFVINREIKAHPMALVHFNRLRDEEVRREIEALTQGYADKTEYFVDHLSRALARLAAALHPRPVIVRTSDFKTNEYANLIGGTEFEPHEENPMLGFRGASRYYSPRYRAGFALECQAISRVREQMGFRNLIVMIPFCRTIAEADRVLSVMAENGLERGREGLQVYVMCEIPSNAILARDFAQRFDGFSIGSNDLTQLTLGVDRDSAELAALFDEQDEAVKWMIRTVIDAGKETQTKVGLCGQGPSDHPEFAEFLVASGIDSISVSPDSFVTVKRTVAAAEQSMSAQGSG